MISFSAQRCTLIFRSLAALFCGLLISSLLSLNAHAQSSDELFRGTWQIETPNQGTLVMIVKGQGRASYFWGDNSDRSVYQGNWTSTEESATLRWSDGSQHRIQRDKLGFVIIHIDNSGSERYSAKAQQVPAEILGQWAKPPAKENALASDRDRAKGYFGIWKIGSDDASAEYVFIESDRSAATTAGAQGGLRGSWAKQGSELHIAWDSGQYSILRPNKREFSYKIIEPGQIIEDDESEMRPAARTIEDKVPSAWMANYKAERTVHTGGIAFSSRKNALAFYRGDWIIKLSENSFERVEIARFGNLNTSLDRNLEGDWKMQGQDIFMRWDDGMRKILSPIGRGFVVYEYKPGRPLDGVPTRTRAATPTDSSKLAAHLKGREDVGQQMIHLAEAAGIDAAQQQEAGWGRTFARWAWPFGENESATSPDAMLAAEYEGTHVSDPWWWPFWSEKAAATAPDSTTDVETAAATTAVETPAPSPDAAPPTAEPEAPTAKKSSAREWIWPF
ncbi:hypothetical protein SH580_09495 [Coraliomargarita algicola]|uniref:Uncharacterized protein n=1 Tax=Coraliomargarita algicola TaxID=3092156 RepID=A0ABZ0RRR7_9BACT|nr:hypothetical protein [Coraliomargarita sp. J2-16]WPJ97944.1 hypothetical protein SH580_09495 [Coraliomargarita sp. J2-16]